MPKVQTSIIDSEVLHSMDPYSVEQSALRDSSLSLNRFERQLKTYHFESRPNEFHSWRFCYSEAVYKISQVLPRWI